MCLKQFLHNDQHTNGTSQDTAIPSSIKNLRDQVFVGSIQNYWSRLSVEERESSEVKQHLNSWCRYFAVLSQCNLDERIGIAKVDRGRMCEGKLESKTPMYEFVTCVLKCLEVVSSHDHDDSLCVADLVDLSLYSQVFSPEGVTKFAASEAVCEKHQAL